MCKVSAARNVWKHVFVPVFVCRNRLNHQWVEVASDLSAFIRNLWSTKMFGLGGGGIGSCRTGRLAGERRGRAGDTESEDYSDTVEMSEMLTLAGCWLTLLSWQFICECTLSLSSSAPPSCCISHQTKMCLNGSTHIVIVLPISHYSWMGRIQI